MRPGATQAEDKKPYPIFTREHFAGAMKAAGQSWAAARQSVSRGDYEGSKALFVRTREQVATTITFWRDRKDNSAVTMVRNGVQSLDDIDVALSTAPVDQVAVGTGIEHAAAMCEACHRAYREQDAKTGAFGFKATVAR